jgi:beta-galactosidase
VSSYEKTFTFKKTPQKRYILHFDGVMAYAEVYVNKQPVISHKGGYTPFHMDITKQLKNGENRIFVMVDSTERPDIPPHGFVVDYLTYGGIYREVYIEEQPQNYIEHALIHVQEDCLHVRMLMDVQKEQDTVFTFNIYKDNQLVYFFEREYDLKKNDILVKEKVYIDPWTLEDPILYELEIIVDEDPIYRSRFANREVKVTTEGFYLNNQKIKLFGLNRHQAFPYVGYAMPKNAQVKDADYLKYELGVNTVRSSHYPPSRHFLNRCDEIGLLVFNEIPGWQHIGDEQWQQVAIENVREMIKRDYNHPSIFIWGVRINESPDNDVFYQTTNEVAKRLDTTRPTGGVRNFKGSHFFEDVYTYNDFVHRGDNNGLDKPHSITKKQVPYLVTEYNGHMYPTKKFDDEAHRLEQVKRHLNVQQASFKNDQTMGAIGWCMFDYNTHKDFGSGDKICYHGVMDMFRIPKDAAYVYKSQGAKEPFIHVASNLQIGDMEASEIKEVYVLSNVDYIKFYINGDYIKTYQPTNRYPHLPHPPFIIDDFIGNLIHQNENFSDKDADIVKDILLSIMKNGLKVPLLKKLKMGYVLFKYKLSMDQAAKFYEKYVGKWGLESLTYTFEGYVDDILVTTQTVGSSSSTDLIVKADDPILRESATYETTRVVVTHINEHKRPLLYSNEVIHIKIDGPLKLIGPSQLSLIGGSIGFYVRTIGETGQATITISSDRFTEKVIHISVE